MSDDVVQDNAVALATIYQAINREAANMEDLCGLYDSEVSPGSVQEAKRWASEFVHQCSLRGLPILVPDVYRNENDFELTWESDVGEFQLNRMLVLVGTAEVGVRDFGHVLRGGNEEFDPWDFGVVIANYCAFLSERIS